LIRRLLLVIPAMLGISVVLFTVLALAPGDPFIRPLGNREDNA
jgi:peptide/nickel transport system permease protein